MPDQPQPAASWSSNTTIEAMADWLRSCRRVVLLTHAKPDGDALGAVLAIARALDERRSASQGTSATPWLTGPLPTWAPLVIGPTPIAHVATDLLQHAQEPDGIVIVDTGAWSQLSEVEPWLRSRTDRAAAIDHHHQGDADVAARRIVDTTAAAACELVASLCQRLLGCDRPAQLPTAVAEPLYLGIATDTGWFRYANVRPTTLRLAADLLETGVDHARLFETVEHQDRPARLRLLARALASLEFHDQDRVAIMTLRQQDFEETHGGPGDSSSFSQLPLCVAAVRVSILLTEGRVDPGELPYTKVSLRSKAGDDGVDVNHVAGLLGGGGHTNAAGARLDVPLDRARQIVLDALGCS